MDLGSGGDFFPVCCFSGDLLGSNTIFEFRMLFPVAHEGSGHCNHFRILPEQDTNNDEYNVSKSKSCRRLEWLQLEDESYQLSNARVFLSPLLEFRREASTEKQLFTVAGSSMVFCLVTLLQRKNFPCQITILKEIVVRVSFSLFRRFGENLSLLIQNIVLVLMAWQFSAKPVGAQEKTMAVLGYAVYVIVVLYLLPEDMRYLLMTSTWPVMLYARGTQVFETYQAKHTGQLSIVTTSMNLVGALIRIATTLKETGDMVVLSGFLLSGALSSLMFFQYFFYLENTKKEMDRTKGKKE